MNHDRSSSLIQIIYSLIVPAECIVGWPIHTGSYCDNILYMVNVTSHKDIFDENHERSRLFLSLVMIVPEEYIVE